MWGPRSLLILLNKGMNVCSACMGIPGHPRVPSPIHPEPYTAEKLTRNSPQSCIDYLILSTWPFPTGRGRYLPSFSIALVVTSEAEGGDSEWNQVGSVREPPPAMGGQVS